MKATFKNFNFLHGMFLLCFSVTIILASCHKSSAPTPGANQVYMQNYAYNPGSINVPVNTTVTWTNMDNMQHTVTSDSEVFNSGLINPGSTYSYQFTKAGSYPYHCTIHTFMHGTVTVH